MYKDLISYFKKQEERQSELNMDYSDNMLLEKYHYHYKLYIEKDNNCILYKIYHNDIPEFINTHELCEKQDYSVYPTVIKKIN